VGATIGRQFAYELLQAVSPLDEETLQRELRQLVDAELVYQRGIPPRATYLFKHALIQDAAYQSLLRSTRQQYHQRIAQAIVERFPDTAETQPELLGHHYTEAGRHEQAVAYWHRAGQRAMQRSAYVEAISHMTKGLEVLATLPATPERNQQELPLHIALGASLIATKGYAAPEVEQTYTRARDLCNSLAQQAQDPAMLLVACHSLGTTLFWQGAVAAAHTHLAQGMALYDPQQPHAAAFLYGQDAGVACCSRAAWTLWYLGCPDQGHMRIQEALARAQQIAHPFSLAYALTSAAVFHQCRREGRAAQERAAATIHLATEQGFPHWRAFDSILHGWALAQQGQAQEGSEQIRQGLIAFHATGAEQARSYWLALLAEAYGTMGQPAAGLTALTEALTLAVKTSERWNEPELHRLKGALLLQQSADNHTEAYACFQHALDMARVQQARSFELRAAISLARLWQQQGRRTEAWELLAPVYGWFTEGFDTADLQDARELLEELHG
jgi:predicted ATPase